MKPEDIIGAWLAGLTIWGVAMLCLALIQHPDAPTRQEPASHGIMVEDWYAQEFQEDGEAAWRPEWDEESDRRRSTFLPPLSPPSRQEGSDNQQNDQPGRQ